MQTPLKRSPSLLPLAYVLLIASLLAISWAYWMGYQQAPAQTMGEHYLRTTPPPEVAIKLTDGQLEALHDAYHSGFSHPDPGGNDPCERLRLLPHKKLATWRRQFSRRGFTMQKIKDILRSGRRELYTHPTKGSTFTKIFDSAGNWIVVDFVDCLIWQVAPHNFH